MEPRMKIAGNKPINGVSQDALAIIKNRINDKFEVKLFALFGSVVRNEADAESDTDLLILTEKKLSHYERHEITNIVSDINLEYDTNFTAIVIDVDSWENGMISVLPFHDEVEREGIVI
jgi:predicted nucleotidyltransferase